MEIVKQNLKECNVHNLKKNGKSAKKKKHKILINPKSLFKNLFIIAPCQKTTLIEEHQEHFVLIFLKINLLYNLFAFLS